MDTETKARKRLTGAQWSGLDQMTAEHAAAAIEAANADFHETLDWSAGSIERLERILNRLSPAPDTLPPADADWLTLLWGSYFGELLRRMHGGDWEMTLYPGSQFSVPTLVVDGSRLYPMMKVHRRLSLGAGESIPAFYAMMTARLGAAPRSGEQP